MEIVVLVLGLVGFVMSFVIVGGIIYYIIIGIVLWLRMPTNNLKLFTAIIVAIFLAVPNLKSRVSFGSVKKSNGKGGGLNDA